MARAVERVGIELLVLVRLLAELTGLALIVAAFWLLAPWAGVLAAGIALILAANFAGRSGSET